MFFHLPKTGKFLWDVLSELSMKTFNMTLLSRPPDRWSSKPVIILSSKTNQTFRLTATLSSNVDFYPTHDSSRPDTRHHLPHRIGQLYDSPVDFSTRLKHQPITRYQNGFQKIRFIRETRPEKKPDYQSLFL